MSQLVNVLVGLLLISTLSIVPAPAQRVSRQAKTFTAKPGFYIQLARCHACAYANWQKETVSALRTSGVSAFVSEDSPSHYTEQRYWVLPSLRLGIVGNEAWPVPVYVGPFDSEDSAKQIYARLPSLLTSIIDKSDQLSDTHFPRDFVDCQGNQCDMGGFFVQLIMVQGQTDPREDSLGAQGIVGNVSQNVLRNAGCGCYFSMPHSKPTIFFSPIEDKGSETEAWMNIDGRDVRLRLVSKTEPKGNLRLGSRLTRTYVFGDLTVHALYVATRVCKLREEGCESASFAGTFTITKAGKTRILKAEGGCGC